MLVKNFSIVSNTFRIILERQIMYRNLYQILCNNTYSNLCHLILINMSCYVYYYLIPCVCCIGLRANFNTQFNVHSITHFLV